MLNIIFFLFFLKSFFCSLKTIPVSEVVKGSIITEYYLYCVESPNGYINLFYKIGEDNYHLVYDEKEDYVSKSKNEKENVKKLEYLNSDKEYLLVSKRDIYYENENNNNRQYLGNGDIFILKNKDFIIINYHASLSKLSYSLNLGYYKYPYNFDNDISFSLADKFIKHYEIIETSEAVLFFLLLDEQAISNPLDIYALDKKL